ncbi:MAG: preprotein translocase subunit SecG [Clostridium sp.]|jgi:preprotein translocase subunit SecG|nr:preprotein translocase subunit SecG [Clostridium sp.]
MGTFFVVMEFILAILLIAFVLLQPSKQDGLRGFIGGGAQDTFFSKNKGRTSEMMFARGTVIVAVLLAVNTIFMHYFV